MKKVPVEVYSRVCGYFRPIKQWNTGQKAQFRDRKYFKVNGEENVGNDKPTPNLA